MNQRPGVRRRAVRHWISAAAARTAFIEPSSPWENGYIESFNARLCDKLLNGEIFYTLKEAQLFIESWRCYYKCHTPAQQPGISSAGSRGRAVAGFAGA